MTSKMKSAATGGRRPETTRKLGDIAEAAARLAGCLHGWRYVDVCYMEEEDAFRIRASDWLWGDGEYAWDETMSCRGMSLKDAAGRLCRRIIGFDPKKASAKEDCGEMAR